MLCATNTNEQTVAANALLNLGSNNIQTGCVATHEENSNVVKLNRPGFYSVHFNANCIVSKGSDTKASKIATVQMYQGSELVDGAISSVDASTKTDVSIDVIVQVRPNCCQIKNCPTTLTFKNVDEEVTYSNTQVTISKIA